MKKIILCLSVAAFLTSCKHESQQLKLNLVQGQTYLQNMVAESTIKQSSQGQEINVRMTMSGKVSYKVTAVHDSVYDMTVQYESIGMKMKMPGGEMEFSSENPAHDGTMPGMMSNMMSAITKKPFQIKITNTGRVTEVQNIEAVMGGMFDGMPQLDTAQREQFKSQMGDAFGEKAFKNNLQNAMAIYSGKPVSKGDTWKQSFSGESGKMPMKVSSTYELTDDSGNAFKIHGKSEITSDNTAPVSMGGMSMKYEMKGSMASDFTVDKKSGWIRNATITQDIKGTTSMDLGNGKPMTIPMSLKSETKITDK